MLRAGLGGLAASLRAIGLSTAAEGEPGLEWPVPVQLGPGEAVVEPTRITLRWGSDPEATLRALFEGAFQARKGLIHLPGAWEASRAWTIQIGAALQDGLKRTFLQHGKSTDKNGSPQPHAFEIDDRTITVTYQPYRSFKHQKAWSAIVKGLKTGSVHLAGWAYPGAVERHTGLTGTKWSYNPGAALCGIFAIVGCLSLQVPQAGGASALVILEPSDLVRFAEIRPRLTPARLEDAYVAGASDAVLHVQLVLRMERLARDRPGVAAVHGVTLRSTPWASQQKSRIATVSPSSVADSVLDAYFIAVNTLPVKLIVTRGNNVGKAKPDSYFAVASALRGFIARNLAMGRRWFDGFATATTSEKQPRYLHRYRSRQDNLGALRPEERSGLIAMTEKLEEAEKYLVRSVHTALRQRFGAIASECEGNLAAMKNRWQGERDRWRIAFSGSKTNEQIRGHLADLWSRGGANRELQMHWEELLPLLRPMHWQRVRDLALVALASYHSTADSADEETTEATSDENEA